MHLLLLPSIDGQQYAQVVAYPDDWSEDRAIQEFTGGLHSAKTKCPEEWGWEEIEEELIKRGFTSPNICYGPLWDEG